EFVTLKKKGVNYVGLCPFHDDKTPSFYVIYGADIDGFCRHVFQNPFAESGCGVGIFVVEPQAGDDGPFHTAAAHERAVGFKSHYARNLVLNVAVSFFVLFQEICRGVALFLGQFFQLCLPVCKQQFLHAVVCVGNGGDDACAVLGCSLLSFERTVERHFADAGVQHLVLRYVVCGGA
ncbi:MAG: hypothetical protein IIU51_02375, partial [Bacteroidaceae bacterium]|nr:hypothetical protein [Bacteroidaceae bacterium]